MSKDIDIGSKTTLDAVLASVAVRSATEDSAPFVLVPDGYSVHDLENTLPEPLTTKQTVALQDIASFVGYVYRFKLEETSIFAPVQEYNKPLSMRASIDYHGVGNPSHARHFADLMIPLSLPWQRWIGINKSWLSQTNFAQFLEQNIVDVRDPEAATIREIVKSMEATKTGQFKSGVRLSNGSHSLMWSEDVQASAGVGNVEIPEKITIGIPIFKDDTLYQVSAFFRYRIQDGKLVLQIELDRAEFLFDAVANTLIAKIGADTGVPVYRGAMK